MTRGLPTLTSFSTPELKQAVKHSAYLHHNWSKVKSRHTHPPEPDKLHFPISAMMNPLTRLQRYVLCPTRDQGIVSLDMAIKPHGVSMCEQNSEGNIAMFPYGWMGGRLNFSDNSLYYLCVERLRMNEMQVDVLVMSFPGGESFQQPTFHRAAMLNLPRPIDLFILDPEARSLCAVYLHDRKTIGLYLVFDWNEGSMVTADTGIPLVSERLT